MVRLWSIKQFIFEYKGKNFFFSTQIFSMDRVLLHDLNIASFDVQILKKLIGALTRALNALHSFWSKQSTPWTNVWIIVSLSAISRYSKKNTNRNMNIILLPTISYIVMWKLWVHTGIGEWGKIAGISPLALFF